MASAIAIKSGQRRDYPDPSDADQRAAAYIQQLGETIEERAQPFDTVPHLQSLWLGRPA